MLLFHAVFASAAAATSASLSSACWVHVWLREVDISVPQKDTLPFYACLETS